MSDFYILVVAFVHCVLAVYLAMVASGKAVLFISETGLDYFRRIKWFILASVLCIALSLSALMILHEDVPALKLFSNFSLSFLVGSVVLLARHLLLLLKKKNPEVFGDKFDDGKASAMLNSSLVIGYLSLSGMLIVLLSGLFFLK